MQVITIEDSAFKNMVGMFETILNTVNTLAAENKQLKSDRLMGIVELMDYTGFGRSWLMQHKEEIGYMQICSSPVKFRKHNVDAFFNKYSIQRKVK
ncbi:hypothetical protein [Mucilaginibacter sp. 10I4]|uniref:hypothetical protein n=1 Tax=Mucilaginibacter sp. 10I4 TaxID=3048580 RepID=UPI002B227BE1|nr:hypothetical protein [Mucilaginibacter sp. 10I4]MEB0262869.1 hypothetical protein [Mucilaginibacter sp. 10I4]